MLGLCADLLRLAFDRGALRDVRAKGVECLCVHDVALALAGRVRADRAVIRSHVRAVQSANALRRKARAIGNILNRVCLCHFVALSQAKKCEQTFAISNDSTVHFLQRLSPLRFLLLKGAGLHLLTACLCARRRSYRDSRLRADFCKNIFDYLQYLIHTFRKMSSPRGIFLQKMLGLLRQHRGTRIV